MTDDIFTPSKDLIPQEENSVKFGNRNDDLDEPNEGFQDAHEVPDELLGTDDVYVRGEHYLQAQDDNSDLNAEEVPDSGMKASETDYADKEVHESFVTDKTFTDVSLLDDIMTTDDDVTVKADKSYNVDEDADGRLDDKGENSNLVEPVDKVKSPSGSESPPGVEDETKKGSKESIQNSIDKTSIDERRDEKSSENPIKIIDDKSSDNSNEAAEKKEESKPEDEGFDGDKDDSESVFENENDRNIDNSKELALMNQKNSRDDNINEISEGQLIETEALDRGSKTNLFQINDQDKPISTDGNLAKATFDQPQDVPTMTDPGNHRELRT